MIVSASRRTDIPAFYGEWFMNRLRAGYAVARNPMNPRQLRRVSLRPGDVDACVFWSKDFRPLLAHIGEIRDAFPIAVHHTLTPYSAPLEPRLTDKRAIVEGMCTLSRAIGPDCLVWRYDPIVLSDALTPRMAHKGVRNGHAGCWAARRGAALSALCSCTRACAALWNGCAACPRPMRCARWPANWRKSPRAHDIVLTSCCAPEELDLTGVKREACISAALIHAATGHAPNPRRDPGQRKGCLCLPSVDIGAYHCCPHMCAYCYANWSAAAVERNFARHDPLGEELLPPVEPPRQDLIGKGACPPERS